MFTTLTFALILSMQGSIERYEKHTKDNQANNKSVSTEKNEQVMPLFCKIIQS